jgi:hypothetical protein
VDLWGQERRIEGSGKERREKMAGEGGREKWGESDRGGVERKDK